MHPARLSQITKRFVACLSLALMALASTGCESMFDGMCEDHDRAAYKQSYERLGYDNATASKKADFDVLWDRMSEE